MRPPPPPHTILTVGQATVGLDIAPTPMYTTVWDERVEQTLKKWKCQAFVYMHLQAESAQYFRRMHDLFTFPVIILNTIASASIFTTERVEIKYAVAAMTTAGAILTGLARQKRPAELAEAHKAAAGHYNDILSDIDSVLTMRSDIRPQVGMYVERTKSEMNNAKKEAPDPPMHILHKFERVYGDTEGMLYGDEIMQILHSGLRTNRALKAYYKRSNGSNGSNDVADTVPSDITSPLPRLEHYTKRRRNSSKMRSGHSWSSATTSIDSALEVRRRCTSAPVNHRPVRLRPTLTDASVDASTQHDMKALMSTITLNPEQYIALMMGQHITILPPPPPTPRSDSDDDCDTLSYINTPGGSNVKGRPHHNHHHGNS